MNGGLGGRGRHGYLLGLLVGCLLAVPVGARAEAPTPSPAGTAPSPSVSPTEAPAATPPRASCESRTSFEHQVVACQAEGLAPDGAVVLRVRPDESPEGDAAWVGGARASGDGSAAADVAIPCGTAGAAVTELSGPLPDGGRFRHRVTLDLAGECSASPVVPPDAWIALASALVGVSALVVVAGAWRHRTRRRRGVTGAAGRPRPGRRGPGRRPRLRRRRRRPSRGRRRRRRRR